MRASSSPKMASGTNLSSRALAPDAVALAAARVTGLAPAPASGADASRSVLPSPRVQPQAERVRRLLHLVDDRRVAARSRITASLG